MLVLSEADLVLALGSRLTSIGMFPDYGIQNYWPKSATIIQVDCNARRLGLQLEITLGICGDAKLVAEHLTAELFKIHPACLENAKDRVQKAVNLKQDWEKALADMAVQVEGERLNPRVALMELEKAIPKVSRIVLFKHIPTNTRAQDALVATDAGNSCGVASSYLKFDLPRSFFGQWDLEIVDMDSLVQWVPRLPIQKDQQLHMLVSWQNLEKSWLFYDLESRGWSLGHEYERAFDLRERKYSCCGSCF